MDVTLENVDLSLFPTKTNQPGAQNKVVLVGCYGCKFTRKAYPLIKKLVSKNPVKYVFAHYPVKDETLDLLPLEYCAYKTDQDKFWELVDILFSTDENDLNNSTYISGVLQSLGYDNEKLNACVNEPQTKINVAQQRIELEKTKIYGTPIVFINGKGLVGPKPYRVYNYILNGWRFW
jgi:protein-disulfide isomerase